MRTRLVGDDVGGEPVFEQPRKHFGGVADDAHRQGAPLVARTDATAHGIVEVDGDLVEVARLDAPLGAGGVDLDAEGDTIVHRDRQRLGAAHATEPGGERDGPGERAAEAPAGDLGEALVRALEDALRADVDPRAGRHLPVHRETEVLEATELGPRRPVGHEVRVGDEHPRRPLVGPEHADGLARLHEHRLVVGERAQRAAHGVERLPRAGGAARPSVDDEVVGTLGDVGVEVVLEHPERRLLRPASAAQLGASRGTDGAGAGAHVVTVPHPAAMLAR